MRNEKNEFGYRLEDLERKMGEKTFGESELNPNWQTWVKVLRLLQETDTIVLLGPATYENSPTLTWLYIYCRILNASYRRDNPIIILDKNQNLYRND